MQAWSQDNFVGVLNRPAGSEAMSGTTKIYKNYKKPLLKILYSDLELLDRIQMSEWVKWKPFRGYGRLLEAVAMPTVLNILSLISGLADLGTVTGFRLLKHRWKR